MVRRAGFTLVELLAVISILGVLFSIVLPAVQYAREAGRKAACKNHLRQVGLATKVYHDTMKRFPYGHFIVQGNVRLDSRPWGHRATG